MGSRALTGRAAAGYFSPMSQAESAAEPAERITFWPLTDVGRVRDHNEDSFLVDKKLNQEGITRRGTLFCGLF